MAVLLSPDRLQLHKSYAGDELRGAPEVHAAIGRHVALHQGLKLCRRAARPAADTQILLNAVP